MKNVITQQSFQLYHILTSNTLSIHSQIQIWHKTLWKMKLDTSNQALIRFLTDSDLTSFHNGKSQVR